MSWYERVSEEIASDLSGFFKFVKSIDGEVHIYNVWWKGLGKDIRIKKHNLPVQVWDKYEKEVLARASAEALKAYKEAFLAYMGH